MRKRLTRLTEPLVRENGALRAGNLGRGAGSRRRRVRRRGRGGRPERVRPVQLLEGDERGELHDAEVRAGRDRHEQHRQLQPDLTRTQRRRSGDGVRGRGRHELVPGGRGDRSHLPVGLERSRDPSDLLPSRPQGRARRRAPVRRRSAPHRLGAVGRRLVRHRRRHRHRALERDGPRDHPTPGCTTASSSSGRRPASTSTRPASSRGRSSAASARPACRPT